MAESLARHRLRVLEAMVALTTAGVMLKVLPFRTTMKLAGGSQASQAEPSDLQPSSHPAAKAVGVAVTRGAAHLPWSAMCLVRALAGRLMLMRRGVPSTIVFGVTKSVKSLEAHAWLVAGGGVVCGGREAANFQPIAALQELRSRDA